MLEKHILGHQNRQNRIIASTVITETVKPKNHFLKWFLVVCMVVLLIVFGIVQFLKSKTLIIHSVQIGGVYSVNTETVKKTIDEYMYSIGTLNILRGNIVLFNKQRLAHHLLDQYASFKNVRVTFSRPYEILVTVDEYTPTYLWCNEYKQCLLSNSEGYLYQYTSEITPGSFPVFYGTLQKNDFELRNNIFSEKKYQDLFSMLDKVTHEHDSHIESITGINYESIIIHMDRLYGHIPSRNVDIRIDSAITYEYLTTMMNILGRDVDFQKSLNNGSVLNYIDLRYPEKIFYKFASSPQINITNTDPNIQVKP